METSMQQIIISHRGNLAGPNSGKENHPDTITTAIKEGFEVEIDLWYLNNKLYLGHDSPQYEINSSFLKNSVLWIHCKHIPALFFMNQFSLYRSDPIYFIHNTDEATLTSQQDIWTYPFKQLTPNSIAVLPEQTSVKYDLSIARGICTDYPIAFRNNINFRP